MTTTPYSGVNFFNDEIGQPTFVEIIIASLRSGRAIRTICDSTSGSEICDPGPPVSAKLRELAYGGQIVASPRKTAIQEEATVETLALTKYSAKNKQTQPKRATIPTHKIAKIQKEFRNLVSNQTLDIVQPQDGPTIDPAIYTIQLGSSGHGAGGSFRLQLDDAITAQIVVPNTRVQKATFLGSDYYQLEQLQVAADIQAALTAIYPTGEITVEPGWNFTPTIFQVTFSEPPENGFTTFGTPTGLSPFPPANGAWWDAPNLIKSEYSYSSNTQVLIHNARETGASNGFAGGTARFLFRKKSDVETLIFNVYTASPDISVDATIATLRTNLNAAPALRALYLPPGSTDDIFIITASAGSGSTDTTPFKDADFYIKPTAAALAFGNIPGQSGGEVIASADWFEIDYSNATTAGGEEILINTLQQGGCLNLVANGNFSVDGIPSGAGWTSSGATFTNNGATFDAPGVPLAGILEQTLTGLTVGAVYTADFFIGLVGPVDLIHFRVTTVTGQILMDTNLGPLIPPGSGTNGAVFQADDDTVIYRFNVTVEASSIVAFSNVRCCLSDEPPPPPPVSDDCKGIINVVSKVAWRGTPRQPVNIFQAVVRYLVRSDTGGTYYIDQQPTAVTHLSFTELCEFWKAQSGTAFDLNGPVYQPTLNVDGELINITSNFLYSNWIWSRPAEFGQNTDDGQDQLTITLPRPEEDVANRYTTSSEDLTTAQPFPFATIPCTYHENYAGFVNPCVVQSVQILLLMNKVSSEIVIDSLAVEDQPSIQSGACTPDPGVEIDVILSYTNSAGLQRQFSQTISLDDLWEEETDITLWDSNTVSGNGVKGAENFAKARWEGFQFDLDLPDGTGLDQCTPETTFAVSGTMSFTFPKFTFSAVAFYGDPCFADVEISTVREGRLINEIQSIALPDPTGGTFDISLTNNGETDTITVDWDVDATTLQTQLEGMSNIGAGNVVVDGDGQAAAGTVTVQTVSDGALQNQIFRLTALGFTTGLCRIQFKINGVFLGGINIPIAPTTSAANVLAAFLAGEPPNFIPFTSQDLAVTGPNGGPWDIEVLPTASWFYRGKPVDSFDMFIVSGLASIDHIQDGFTIYEIQKIILGNNPQSGYYTLTLGGGGITVTTFLNGSTNDSKSRWTITLDGVAFGSCRIRTIHSTYGFGSFIDIPATATAADVQALIEGMPEFEPGEVTVTTASQPFGSPHVPGQVHFDVTVNTLIKQANNPSDLDPEYTWDIGDNNGQPADLALVEDYQEGQQFLDTQDVQFNLNPTSGSFILSFQGQSTAPIPYNATATQVRDALELISTIGGVLPPGAHIAVERFGVANQWRYRVYFGDGASWSPLIGVDLPLLTASTTFPGDGDTTTAIPYNAGNLAVQQAIEALPILVTGNLGVFVSRTGTPNNFTWTVQFSRIRSFTPNTQYYSSIIATDLPQMIGEPHFGDSGPTASFLVEFVEELGGIDIDLMVGDGTNLIGNATAIFQTIFNGTANERQTITNTSGSSQSFRVTFNGVDSIILTWDSTLNIMQTALEGISSIGTGNVDVTGNITDRDTVYTGPWYVDFKGIYAGINVPAMTVTSGYEITTDWDGGTGVNETQDLVLNADAGTFTVTVFDPDSVASATTSALAFDVSAVDLQDAIVGAAAWIDAADLSVEKLASNRWRITFLGALANRDIDQSTADATNLTGGTVLIVEEQKGSNLREKQSLTIVNATGGSFRLNVELPDFPPQMTDDIPWDATINQVKNALEELDGLGPGSVAMAGAWPTYDIMFPFIYGNVPEMTADVTDLICSAFPIIPVEGGPYPYPLPHPGPGDPPEDPPLPGPIPESANVFRQTVLQRHLFDPNRKINGQRATLKHLARNLGVDVTKYTPYLRACDNSRLVESSYDIVVDTKLSFVLIEDAIDSTAERTRILTNISTHRAVLPARFTWDCFDPGA